MDRKERKERGICYDCNEPALPSRCRCEYHARKQVQNVEKYLQTEKGKQNTLAARKKRRVHINTQARLRKRGVGRFTYVRGCAVGKGRVWTITQEEYESITALNCHYCGHRNDVEAGIGLDRLDNERGYELDNVVSCCAICNLVRGDRFTPDEMKLLGQTIAGIKQTRATFRPREDR